jgi:hypothetical protein
MRLAALAALCLQLGGAPHASPPVSPPVSPVSTSPAREALARQDAAALLAQIKLPTGAVALSAPPVSAGGVLNQVSSQPLSSDLVDLHRFAEVAGTPQSVLSWIVAHRPKAASETSTGSASAMGVKSWQVELSWPALAGVLTSRSVVIDAIAASPASTALRLDAQVIWSPPRSSYDTIPPAAKVLRLQGGVGTATTPSGRPADPSGAAITISDPAQVARIAAAVNALPLFPSGIFSCPLDRAGSVWLTFSTVATGPPLAVVVAETSGCQTVSVSVNGHAGQPLEGGGSLVDTVEAVVGHKLVVPGLLPLGVGPVKIRS